MVESYDPNVGLRIRYLRKQKGLTLRDLSELSGLSINAISRIENHQTSPTVFSVHRLANALEVPIAALFDGTVATRTVHVKADNRQKIQMKGRCLEPLGTGMINPRAEPFLVTLDPHEKTTAGPDKHTGEEFAFCLEGIINFNIDGADYELHPGDSLFFKSEQPHTWNNPGEIPAEFLLMFLDEEHKPSSTTEEYKIMDEFIPA